MNTMPVLDKAVARKGKVQHVPLEEAMAPRSGYCYAHHYWVIDTVDGRDQLVFHGAQPKCDTSLQRLVNSSRKFAHCRVERLPAVFLTSVHHYLKEQQHG